MPSSFFYSRAQFGAWKKVDVGKIQQMLWLFSFLILEVAY